jgi:pimeloyl-ACP methyl ester carboxylesterase
LLNLPILVLAMAGLFWFGGTLYSAPAMQEVGPAPRDLDAIDVEFSGIHGWFVRAAQHSPCIILMHGVRANRSSMIERARFLRKNGYSSLLFDFQAHGESPGSSITFGYLESRNARSAVEFLRSEYHYNKIAVIGQSLGGAAALLGDSPLKVNALILESVYPTIENAISNRLQMYLGLPGIYLEPFVTVQLNPRFGITGADLRPISKIHSIKVPVFVIAGTEDRHTRIEESKQFFNEASHPKQFWAVPGAAHEDLHHYAQREYETRVLNFLKLYLRNDEP